MFLFSVCQAGAENAFKNEVKRFFPDWHAAFARPGFVSFKTDGGVSADVLLETSVLARTCAESLGKITAGSDELLTDTLWKLVAERHLFINRIHCFRREPFPPGEKGFEPGLTAGLIERHRKIVRYCPMPKLLGKKAADAKQPAISGENVLDVLEVDKQQFLAGVHRITGDSPLQSLFAGGVAAIQLPADAASRAWLKFEEGLRWSGFNINRDSLCIDIGSSPGGCSQVLLSRKAAVFGIDPGEMHASVLKHPKFTHIRKRVRETKRSLFGDADYIFGDLNTAPNYMLDVLEEIVPLTGNRFKGAVFTLKLIHWNLVANIPQYTERIRKLGFRSVRVKQLAFNRQEVMVAAGVDW
ncbi:MAG: hypothetical protein LBT46_15575 [Planctomycetaceae bacterium]|jgi:23S rRNA (cytidine2498-2'-O)-methyltransferase|nr:hypothetical protein [Planctomycetaceae bacterium]